MNSSGGGQTGFSKRELYTVAALLVMVFVAAGAMFAVPAWSQSKSEDSQKDKKTSEQQKRTQSSSTQTTNSPAAKLAGQNPSAQEALQAADQVEASQDLNGEDVNVFENPIEAIEIDANNCNVDPGDSITFEVVGGPDSGNDPNDVAFATVIDGVNAAISTSNNGDLITVEDIDNPNNPIEFFVEEEDGGFDTQTLNGNDDLVVDSSTIDCGKNNNNNNNNGNNNNRHNNRHDNNDRRDRIRDLLNAEDDLLNDETSTLEDEDNLLDAETSTLENEDTLGDSGVSANADENGASAETPGASASANGDEDTLGPVGPQGDVVDEVPTSGPLPDTGGVPVATGTVLALVFFGVGLLVVRLVMIWRERT